MHEASAENKKYDPLKMFLFSTADNVHLHAFHLCRWPHQCDNNVCVAAHWAFPVSAASTGMAAAAAVANKKSKINFCVAFFSLSRNYFQCVHIECICASNKNKRPHSAHSSVINLVDFMLNSSKFVKKYRTTVGTRHTVNSVRWFYFFHSSATVFTSFFSISVLGRIRRV